MCKDKYCKEVYAEFDKLHDYYIGEINKFKKCLNEIEEICNENKYPSDEYDFVAFFANKILQKIKEVKGNE